MISILIQIFLRGLRAFTIFAALYLERLNERFFFYIISPFV